MLISVQVMRHHVMNILFNPSLVDHKCNVMSTAQDEEDMQLLYVVSTILEPGKAITITVMKALKKLASFVISCLYCWGSQVPEKQEFLLLISILVQTFLTSFLLAIIMLVPETVISEISDKMSLESHNLD